MITTATVPLPDFGREEKCPIVPVEVYHCRLAAALERMQDAGVDVLVVYADREHFANLAYLTGFDPRFEEALFLLDATGGKLLLVGNECLGYLPDESLGIHVELFQELSLLGQQREASRPLQSIFSDFGVRAGGMVGCVGWKYFDLSLAGDPPLAIEIPAYIVDALRSLAGADRVINATDMFMNPDDGLRIHNEAEQIAFFEYASTVTSEGVLSLLRNIRDGVEEQALEKFLDARGLPLSCHRMTSFGEKARRGLSSPSSNTAKLGDPYTVAFGVTGALTCRAGCVARGPQDLHEDGRDFYEQLVRNYFEVVSTWYGQIAIGAAGGAVYDAVESRRDSRLFDFAVNPGHYLHLDEWVHSPFSSGSDIALESGMAIQMDIIPVSRGPFYYANAEDGIVLADGALQADLADRFPGCWQRMLKRRQFMADAIGIDLHESVLPLSNMPAWLPPYSLDLETAMVQS